MKLLDSVFTDLPYEVSREVLELAFSFNKDNLYNGTTLNEQIFTLVIKPKVFKDWNLVGGVSILVDLSLCDVVQRNNKFTVFKIPKHLTKQRSILNALMLTPKAHGHGYMNTGIVGLSLGNGLQRTIAKAGTGIIKDELHTSVDIELLGENTVVIYGDNINYSLMNLEVEVENNLNLSNLHTSQYPLFGEFAILAIKAYIYKHLDIKLDKGRLMSGYNVGKIREEIDEFKDSIQSYKDMLKDKIGLINKVNDHKLMNDIFSTL